MVQKISVPGPGAHELSSNLTQILEAVHRPAEPEGALISVFLYLPSRDRIEVKVLSDASVQDTIEAAIKLTRDDAGEEPLEDDPDCYELRMHDYGGEPDEDFPGPPCRHPPHLPRLLLP